MLPADPGAVVDSESGRGLDRLVFGGGHRGGCSAVRSALEGFDWAGMPPIGDARWSAGA